MADNPTPGTEPEQAPKRARKRPAHLWPKGVSGNPNGRPPTPPELRDKARLYGEGALEVLRQIATSKARHVSAAARVRAAEVLLARGYGQPTQPLEHAGADGGALTVVIRREGETKP